MTRVSRHTSLLVTTALALGVTMVGPPAADAAPTWLPEKTLTVVGQTSQWPQLVTDKHGTTTAVWSHDAGSGDFVVEASSRPAGGAWSAAQPISDAGQDASIPDIAVDDAGNVTAVWYRFNGTKFVIQASSRPVGGAWSDPVDLSDDTQSAFNAQVAMSPSGTATAVWTRSNGTNDIVQSSSKALNGAWTGPDDLSDLGGNASDPQLAVDPAGRATAVWIRNNGAAWVVQAASRAEGGAWTDPDNLSNTSRSGFGPQVGVDAAGNATAAWYWSTGIGGTIAQVTDRPLGGSWAEPHDLSAVSVDANGVRLAVDPTGDATAVWQTYDGIEYIVEAATRTSGGAWSGKQEISNTGSSWDPAVIMDATGTATATWFRGAAGGNYALVAVRRALAGAWSAPQDISGDDFPAGPDQDLAVDPAGDVTVVWDIETSPAVHAVGTTTLDVAGPLLTSFAPPGKATAGKAAAFSVAATDTWSQVASYAWAFGDGKTGAGPVVKHAYAKPGSYPVKVTVTDAVGNVTSRTATVKVVAPRPVIKVLKLTDATIGVGDKTKLKVRLNTKATLKLVFKGKAHGVKALLKKKLPKGTSKLTLSTTVGGKALVPDTYVITATATNKSGTSKRRTITMKVVR